jgi:hypothetical protein
MRYQTRSLMIAAAILALVAQSASAQATSQVRIPRTCMRAGKDECVTKTETTFVRVPGRLQVDTVIKYVDREVPKYVETTVVPKNDRSWTPYILAGLGTAALGGAVAYFTRGSVKQYQCVSVNSVPCPTK